VTTAWRGLVNQVTYGLDLTTADDGTAAAVADALVLQRSYVNSVAEYHDAVTAALDSREPLAAEPSDDLRTRAFLARLHDELERRRPWPDAPYVQLDHSAWSELATAPVVGRVPLRRREVGARLNRLFADVDEGGTAYKTMVLRLRTGQVVGLSVPSAAREPGVAVMTRDDPATTLAALRELTAMPVEPATA
jgi:hypothetical protein